MSPAAGKLERKVLEHVLPLSNLRSSHSCSCFMFRSASGHQIPLPFLQLRVPKPRGMHHLPRALADSGSATQGPGDGGAAAAVPRAALSEPKHGQVSLGLGTVLETFFFLKEKQYCFPQEVKSRAHGVFMVSRERAWSLQLPQSVSPSVSITHGCVALDKLFNFSTPQLPHRSKEDVVASML